MVVKTQSVDGFTFPMVSADMELVEPRSLVSGSMSTARMGRVKSAEFTAAETIGVDVARNTVAEGEALSFSLVNRSSGDNTIVVMDRESMLRFLALVNKMVEEILA